MNVEEIIEEGLFGSVRDLDTFTDDEKAWPNVTFDPPAGAAAYVRVDHLPNGNQRVFMAGTDPHIYLGILQLTVISPLNAGPATAMRLAAEAAAAYPADRDIFDTAIRIRIEKAPDVGQAIPVDASWNVVVSIRYEALATQGARGEGMLDFSYDYNSQYIPLI